MKEKILACLKEQEGYVSGQSICEELGVSRTAIWKYINVLRQEGYIIESVTRKGYRLLQSPDLISREELLTYLPEMEDSEKVHYYPSVDSTNEAAKRAAAGGAPDGSIFVADRQTAGRGRRGRTWISPGGEDVFFSVLLRPDIAAQSASMLTLLAALSAVTAAEKHSGEPCQIKWPNDIILHDRKVCGILTEMAVEMGEIDYVVVGIGFNLNRTCFDEDIADMASSLFKETGRRVIRAAFLGDFIRDFQNRYRTFTETVSLKPFMEEYNSHLINTGRQVKLVKKEQTLIRTALGINDRGELLVRDEEGHIEEVLSGEVSVRGLYGYVQ